MNRTSSARPALALSRSTVKTLTAGALGGAVGGTRTGNDPGDDEATDHCPGDSTAGCPFSREQVNTVCVRPV